MLETFVAISSIAAEKCEGSVSLCSVLLHEIACCACVQVLNMREIVTLATRQLVLGCQEVQDHHRESLCAAVRSYGGRTAVGGDELQGTRVS